MYLNILKGDSSMQGVGKQNPSIIPKLVYH